MTVPAQRRTGVLVASRGAGGGGTGALHRAALAGGRLTALESLPAEDLSCVVRHPGLPVVYGTCERDDGRVTAWSTDGRLAVLGSCASGGAGPCHLAVHPSGRALVVAHYTSGDLAVVRLGADGAPLGAAHVHRLSGAGPVAGRQDGPHPHQVLLVAGGAVALVPDLGADLLRVLALDVDAAALREVAVSPLPAGTGPRHAVLAPGGTVVVTGELAQTVTAAAWDERTALVGPWSVTPSTRRSGTANFPGDLALLPGAPRVAVANRGADTLALVGVRGHRVELVGEVDAGVRWPQHLAVSGGALLVAGRDSGQVAALALEDDGSLGPARTAGALPSPVWITPEP